MKIKKKPIPLLAKKLKAEPKKRQKRGILRKTKTGKKPVVLKTVKPKKRVSFGKKRMYGERQIQQEVRYAGDMRYGQKARTFGSAGDPLPALQPRMRTNPATGVAAYARTRVTPAQAALGMRGRKIFEPRMVRKRRLILA